MKEKEKSNEIRKRELAAVQKEEMKGRISRKNRRVKERNEEEKEERMSERKGKSKKN